MIELAKEEQILMISQKVSRALTDRHISTLIASYLVEIIRSVGPVSTFYMGINIVTHYYCTIMNGLTSLYKAKFDKCENLDNHKQHTKLIEVCRSRASRAGADRQEMSRAKLL